MFLCYTHAPSEAKVSLTAWIILSGDCYRNACKEFPFGTWNRYLHWNLHNMLVLSERVPGRATAPFSNQYPATSHWECNIRCSSLEKEFSKVLFIVAAFVLCYLPFSLSIRTSNNKRGRTLKLIILLGGSSCIHSVIYFWRIKELKRAAKGQIFRVCKCFSSDKRRSDLTAVDRVLKQWFTQPIIFCNQQHFSHAQIKKCKNQGHNCIFAHSFSRT